MFDLFREIYQTLRNNKLRTFLTGISVAWGIFMLIILLGMARGVTNGFEDSPGNRGTNTIAVWGGRTSKAYAGYKEGRTIQLKNKDTGNIKSEGGEHIDDVTSFINGSSSVISTPHDYITARYRGVYPSYLKLQGEEITEGRFINEADMEYKRKVIVLTRKNANILFEDTTKIVGGIVEMGGLSFTVIGVFDPEWGEDTFIPYTTAKMINGDKDDVDNLTVTIKDVYTQEDCHKVELNIRQSLANVHNFNYDDNSAIWVWNRFNQYLTAQSAMGILPAVIWIIGILTMLSGIVGVSNIMFVSVKERTHEIGIRRAIGAKPKNILTQILMESVAITGLFGYIGVFFGILATEGISMIEMKGISNPTVDITIAIQVTVVLILSGCLAGLFPALKALKVKPVEALRDE